LYDAQYVQVLLINQNNIKMVRVGIY